MAGESCDEGPAGFDTSPSSVQDQNESRNPEGHGARNSKDSATALSGVADPVRAVPASRQPPHVHHPVEPPLYCVLVVPTHQQKTRPTASSEVQPRLGFGRPPTVEDREHSGSRHLARQAISKHRQRLEPSRAARPSPRREELRTT